MNLINELINNNILYAIIVNGEESNNIIFFEKESYMCNIISKKQIDNDFIKELNNLTFSEIIDRFGITDRYTTIKIVDSEFRIISTKSDYIKPINISSLQSINTIDLNLDYNMNLVDISVCNTIHRMVDAGHSFETISNSLNIPVQHVTILYNRYVVDSFIKENPTMDDVLIKKNVKVSSSTLDVRTRIVFPTNTYIKKVNDISDILYSKRMSYEEKLKHLGITPNTFRRMFDTGIYLGLSEKVKTRIE